MRVYCKVCGQRGRITKTNRLSDDVSGLYCQCTDAECGHLVVRPHTKPLGQDHQPAGSELDGVTDPRGAAAGTERTGGAIAPLVIFSLLHNGSSSGIPSSVMVTTAYPFFVPPTRLTIIKK